MPTCAACVFGVALWWGRVPFGGVPGLFMAYPATTPRLLPVPLAVFSKSICGNHFQNFMMCVGEGKGEERQREKKRREEKRREEKRGEEKRREEKKTKQKRRERERERTKTKAKQQSSQLGSSNGLCKGRTSCAKAATSRQESEP